MVQQSANREDLCPICSEPISDGDEVITIVANGRQFHRKCYERGTGQTNLDQGVSRRLYHGRECFLCGLVVEESWDDDFQHDIYGVRCRRCGRYRITFECSINARSADKRILEAVSAATRQASDSGSPLLLTSQSWDEVAATSPTRSRTAMNTPTDSEIRRRILELLVEHENISATEPMNSIRLAEKSGLESDRVKYQLHLLARQGLIVYSAVSEINSPATLTPAGRKSLQASEDSNLVPLTPKTLMSWPRRHSSAGDAVQSALASMASSSRRSLRVFLCHTSGDKKEIRNLYLRLKADGVDPWLDEENLLPGQDWKCEIRNAVSTSDVVLVCLSSRSIHKPGYVQKEIMFALDTADEQPENTIFVIPLRIEECEVPDRLSRWQWVDLFAPSGYGRLIRALAKRAEDLGITPPRLNPDTL
ncbi:MAG: TIR domain-containing protein [Bryobacteraceae bacterium]|nr:TIR domain-containing protein [Bryobacteraceae bacterium]